MLFHSKELLIQPYTPGTVIGEFTSSGTRNVTFIGSGTYEIIAVSGGGGGMRWDIGNSWHAYSRGGTGAYYNGLIRITAGTYSVSVGSGGSGTSGSSSGGGGSTSIANVFTLTGAGSEWYTYAPPEQFHGGAGGSLTSISNEISRIAYSAGNNGYHVASLEDNWWYTFGNQSSPAANYGLSSYGQGGGVYYNSGIGASYGSNGTGGYLKITYKGV